MSFLSAERVAAAEGKFVKFQNGVPRTFKLLSHKTETRTMFGKAKSVDEITVIDVDTKEEKVLTANGKFMSELARLDSQLVAGDTIRVIPEAKTFNNAEGEEIQFFSFSITKVDVEPVF